MTLAAVRGGARQIQGTLNGLGERCGNANLCSLIPTLLLKEPYASQFETGLSREQLETHHADSRLLDEILNRAPNRHAAYVGPSAFAHKGGLHSSAVQKDPRTYEHVPPETVGNKRRILVSDQAGRSSLLVRLSEAGIDIDARDGRLARLLEDVKQREFLGYAYDGAEASFELLARRALGEVPEYFDVESFRVMVERRNNALGEWITVSEAVVKVKVGDETFHNVAIGNGPVNALDSALRKDLGKYSSFLQDLRLVDYKVRILTGGTEAVTRVMVESADGKGARWSTVGVSPNIVDASFEALTEFHHLQALSRRRPHLAGRKRRTMRKMPDHGLDEEAVFQKLTDFAKSDVPWREGKTLAYIYDGGPDVERVAKRAYMQYLTENALDPTVYPSLARMERELIGFAAAHLNGSSDVVGNFTSGGTESCMLAVKTARDYLRKKKPEVTAPEIVLPATAHAAFHKAAEYSNSRKCPCLSTSARSRLSRPRSPKRSRRTRP